MKRLAIVIPAFKPMYFEQTLKSIEKQSNQNFKLYIGDDASPHDLQTIVEVFKNRIDMEYMRFEENWGSKNLVAHWERCIDLIGEEEWVWLFSDDDIMDARCVEEFYCNLEVESNFDLYHFNLVKIDQYGNEIEVTPNYPDPLSMESFVEERLVNGLRSYAVEYIFRRSQFMKVGRFEKFDLAWCSDDATWIKLGGIRGIKSLAEAKVYWRKSPFNITPNYTDVAILRRKSISMVEFSKWLIRRCQEKNLNIPVPLVKQFLATWFVRNYRTTIPYLGYKDYAMLVPLTNKSLNLSGKDKLSLTWVYSYKIFRWWVERIKSVLKPTRTGTTSGGF